MANALELHRQLANNSKKKNVIDMADIKSIADNARVQNTTAPLNTANIQNNIEPIQSSSLQNLPTLKGTATFNTKTQDTINKLSEKGNEVEKWNLISGLTKFGAGVATAAMPYNEGKSVRSGLQNVANDQAKKASDLSEFSNEELAEAYNNMGNYNILERIADPNKRGQYSAKQLTAPYAMIDAYNKIEEQGGIDEFNSRFGSDKLLASHFSDVGGLGSVLRNGYLKPFADKYGISEDALSMLVNAKANSELEQMYSDYAKEHPVASSALSVPANVLGSVPSTLYGVKNAITGETIDTNSPFYSGRDYASTTRGTVSEGINSDLGKFAYNTGMSMGDSLASMAVGYATGYPAIGTAIMGAGAYSDTLKDGIERGLTPDAAQATALGAGLAEYGFEKISWGRLGDIAEGKIDAKLWQQIASQMATEGGEELATDLTNMLVDNLVNGGASEMMQQKDALVAQGMDEASAEKQVMKDYAKQLATSFAGGAVSGGIMGGGASAINYARNSKNSYTANPFELHQQLQNQASNTNQNTELPTLKQQTETQIEMQNKQKSPQLDMLNPQNIFNSQNNTQSVDVSKSADNVNQDVVTADKNVFSGTNKVVSVPDMSKNLQKYINMHGSENAKQLYIKFNDAVNNALENADLDSFNEAILLAEQIENNLQTEGHNYTTKGSKNGKKPGRTYQYEADSFMGTFNSYMSDMNEKYLDSKAKLQSAENNNVVSIPATRDNTVSISEPVNIAQTSQTQNSSSQSQSSDSGNQYVSKTVKNSIMNSEMVKRAQENLDAFQGEIDNGNFKVDKVSEKESIERAAQNLSDDYEGTMKRLSETDTFINGVETDESMMILNDMLKEAEQNKDYSKVMQWSKDIVKKAHNAGQALQALAKYTRTPAGTIAKAEQLMQDQTDSYFKEHKGEKSTLDNSIDDLWAELEKAQNNADFLTIGDNQGAVSRDQITKLVKDVIRKNKGLKKMNQSEIDHIVDSIQSGVDHTLIAEEIQNYAATGLFGLSDEDMEYIMDILGKAEKMPDSKERYELENMAFDRIANRVVTKKSFMDKLDAWRYLAMLSNPKTVLRNVLGNKLNGFRVGIDNSIASLIEKQISKKFGIERTKEVLDRKSDADLIKAATADAEQKVYSVLKDGGDKYRNAQSRIESSKSAFNSKVMQSVDNITTKMLDDFPAMKAKYGTSLAGYMKANDMDMSYFNVEEDLADAKSRLSEATEKSDISRIQKEVSDLTAKKNKMDKARAYAVDKAKYATFHEYSKFASYINTLSSNLKNGGWLGKAGHMVIEGVIPFKKTPANVMKQGAMLATGPAQAGIGIYQLYNALKYGENSKYDATKAIERIATGLDGTGIMLLGGLLSSLGLVVSVPDDEKDNKYNKLTGGQNYAVKLGDNYYTIDWLSPVAIPLFVGVDSQQLITNKTDKSFMDVVADMSAPMIEMSMLQGLSNTLESASNSDSAFDTAVEIGASAGTNYLSQYVPTLFGQVARTVDNTRRDNVGDATGVAGDLQYALNKAENKVPFLSMTNQPYIDAWGNQQKDENNILLRAAYNAFSPGYYSKQEKDSVEKELDVIRKATDDSSVYPSTASRKVNTVEGEVRLPGSDYTQYATKKGNIQHDTLNTLFKSDVYKWLTDAQKADVVKAVYKNSGLVAQNTIGYKSKSQDAYEAYKSDGVDGIINLSLKSAGLSESAISVINEKGSDGYKKYTEMKSAADTDGNGNIKQAEIKAYLDGQVMLDAQKAYWFDAFCPNAKENPYRKANDKNTTTKTTSNATDDEYLRYVKSILGH